MDDWVILTKTKRQYQRAKKKMFEVLKALKLKISPHKTKMGKLTSFHFLGVQFSVTQTTPNKTQVKTTLHARSCRRALTKVKTLRADAVNSVKIQGYLCQWAAWWKVPLKTTSACLMRAWITHTAFDEPKLLWYAVRVLYAWSATSPHTRL
jgi:hypothetical protein